MAEHGQERLRSSGKLTLVHGEAWAAERCRSRQEGGNWAYSLLFVNFKTWMCSDECILKVQVINCLNWTWTPRPLYNLDISK